MYGRGYVTEHIAAFFRNRNEELRYRVYITEALRVLTENTTHHLIGGVGAVDYGTKMKDSWYTGRNPAKEQQDEKTADEIALDVIRRAGLRLKEQDNGGS